MNISLVLVTLNEIHGIKTLVDKIPGNEIYEIICIDGGSTDGSREYLKEQGISVWDQTEKGRGGAFREAFKIAKGDALLFFSPDGNEDPCDIPKFKKYLEAGADIVAGTRMIAGARNEEDDKILKWRKWVNNVFNLIANITWNKGLFVTDSINGFRAYRRSAWDKLKLDGQGYTIEYQGSIRAMKLGLKVVEFPTVENNRIGPDKCSPSLSTGLAFLKLYFREILVGNKF